MQNVIPTFVALSNYEGFTWHLQEESESEEEYLRILSSRA
jgi:hypothetical protein